MTPEKTWAIYECGAKISVDLTKKEYGAVVEIECPHYEKFKDSRNESH